MRVGISGVAIRKWLFSATGTDFEYLSTGGDGPREKGEFECRYKETSNAIWSRSVRR
jgi:hypothetical protein